MVVKDSIVLHFHANCQPEKDWLHQIGTQHPSKELSLGFFAIVSVIGQLRRPSARKKPHVSLKCYLKHNTDKIEHMYQSGLCKHEA
jgi:hypothetical protein